MTTFLLRLNKSFVTGSKLSFKILPIPGLITRIHKKKNVYVLTSVVVIK